MATEVNKSSSQEEVVSIQLPAPPGWKKQFFPKKGGTPRKSEIVFTSPTGEKLHNHRQLQQYLKAHPGGPSESEFDWGTGETPRRSARIRGKAKSTSPVESEPPKKRHRTSSASKKGGDVQIEDTEKTPKEETEGDQEKVGQTQEAEKEKTIEGAEKGVQMEEVGKTEKEKTTGVEKNADKEKTPLVDPESRVDKSMPDVEGKICAETERQDVKETEDKGSDQGQLPKKAEASVEDTEIKVEGLPQIQSNAAPNVETKFDVVGNICAETKRQDMKEAEGKGSDHGQLPNKAEALVEDTEIKIEGLPQILSNADTNVGSKIDVDGEICAETKRQDVKEAEDKGPDHGQLANNPEAFFEGTEIKIEGMPQVQSNAATDVEPKFDVCGAKYNGTNPGFMEEPNGKDPMTNNGT